MLVAICLCIGLCACGNDSKQTVQDNPNYVAANVTTESVETTDPTEPDETTEPTEPPIVYTEINQGETVVTANSSEFVITAVDWVYELKVRTGEHSIHSFGEASDGNILMYLKVTYTNNDKVVFDYNQYYKWDVSLIYNGEYTYTPKSIGDVFSGYELQPLMTGDFYIIFELPEALKFDGKELNITFAVNDVHYSFQAREEGSATEMDTSLNVDEKKVIDGKGEITLVNTTTTKKLMPPKASGWYTYYEAREGYTYVVSEFVVKNLGQESIHTSETIKGSVLVDGQPVEGMCVLASGDKSNLSANYGFDVLAEHTAYFIAEVPDDKLSADISFSIMFGQEKFEFPFSA